MTLYCQCGSAVISGQCRLTWAGPDPAGYGVATCVSSCPLGQHCEDPNWGAGTWVEAEDTNWYWVQQAMDCDPCQ